MAASPTTPAPDNPDPHAHANAWVIASAMASGASTGQKWPMPSTGRRSARENHSPMRSPHARGKSGSCSGQSTVVGTAMRSAGGCSVSASATVPEPARYQPIDAENAPGAAYRSVRWSSRPAEGSNPGPDQWV